MVRLNAMQLMRVVGAFILGEMKMCTLPMKMAYLRRKEGMLSWCINGFWEEDDDETMKMMMKANIYSLCIKLLSVQHLLVVKLCLKSFDKIRSVFLEEVAYLLRLFF